MSTSTREFGSKAKDAAIEARVKREYTPEQWAASRQTAASQATARANQGTVNTLRELSASRTPWVTNQQIDLFVASNSAQVVAERIDWLQEQPVWREARDPQRFQDKPLIKGGRKIDRPAVTVPEGRYAVVGTDGATKFYKVDRPTEGRWAGYVFVKVQAGDELFNLKTRSLRDSVLNQIAAAGVQASMELYGRELGHCGHCGRTLTNEDSRARGIGPVCASKMGF